MAKSFNFNDEGAIFGPLPLESLEADFTYQPRPSDRHVKEIMAAWLENPWTIGPIETNVRDGHIYVIDGWQRTCAARLLGHTQIMAIQHHGWTQAQEARRFRDSDKDKKH